MKLRVTPSRTTSARLGLITLLAGCAVSGRSQPHFDTGPTRDAAVTRDTRAPSDIDAASDAASADAFVAMPDGFVSADDARSPGLDAFAVPTDAFVPRDAFVAPNDAHASGTLACATTSCIGQLVISEVALRSAASAADEFVEVQNTGTASLDLSGLELVYASASGVSSHRATVQSGLVVGPGHFALFGSSTMVGPTPDVTERWTVGMADAGGTVELRAGTTSIDRFGWGTAMSFEGAAYGPAITSGDASYERKANATSTAASMASGGADALAGNRYDTDHNATDFVTRTMRDPATTASGAE